MSCHITAPSQTQFLGASVSDFNMNMGWGGQASQLTVTLVEDKCGTGSGNAKVYYNTDVNNGIVVGSTTAADPGFFGETSDIINGAYFFKMGGVEFLGVVRSWEKSRGSGGTTYTVTLDSIDYILDHSYVICNKYTGTIFTKSSSATYGGPYNYAGSVSAHSYTGTLADGVVPNVFNAYGLLESGGFGWSGRNDRGIPANLIVRALSVLTSTENANETHTAFSPLGRIILKNGTGSGSLYKSFDANGVNRTCCILDTSDLPSAPSDFRISSDVVTINELVSTIADAVGVDFYWKSMLHITPAVTGATVLVPAKPYIVMKLMTRSRTSQLATNVLQNMLSSGNYIANSSAVTVGKEKNNVTNRTMIIGANQQRLYQANVTRLSYGQSNYIWHPITGTFVDYSSYGNGTAKLPSGLSIRNPYLTFSSSNYNTLVTSQQIIQNDVLDFDSYGNSGSFNISNVTRFPKPAGANIAGGRYLPLYWDAIFPFFGFTGREESTPEPNSDSINPNYRSIRPCYIDKWSGNIVIAVYAGELPLNLQASFSGSFLVSETEIRAATAGWESYLTYCMTKVYKPDLYSSLISYYSSSLTNSQTSNVTDGQTPNSDTNDQDLTGNMNVANNLGYLTGGGGVPNPTMSVDVSFIINPDLLRDFVKISEYVAGFGQYYGKSYMVRLPKVDGYRDMGAASFAGGGGDVVGYSGSGKTFFGYEPAPDGAWEEYGNDINGDIVVGSAKWYALINDDGKIPPLLAFNAGTTTDWIQKAACNSSTSINDYRTDLTALHRMLAFAHAAGNRTTKTGSGPAAGMVSSGASSGVSSGT